MADGDAREWAGASVGQISLASQATLMRKTTLQAPEAPPSPSCSLFLPELLGEASGSPGLVM
jgi:hypothetical protein